MKHTRPAACLSLALLRYVRDQGPTEQALVDWLGPAERSRFYVLRKAGLLRVTDGRVALSPAHASADGKRFRFENQIFSLDEDRIVILRSDR